MGSRHWLYFGGFVVSAILAVATALLGLLEGLTALSAGVQAGEGFVLLTMLGAAAEWVVLTLVLGVVALLFLAGTVVSVLRSASLPRDDRLVTLVEWLERQYPMLRKFDVADKVEPTTEDRKRQLKDQYVNGEISEAEFERRLAQLMDDRPEDSSRAESRSNLERNRRSR